jgi:NAD(P)-dependent dehydrogenase (short-subunit alcohol dehydrogenase family)
MQQKRALVTGGGARLGRAMALYLGERGFDVAVHYSTSREGAEGVAKDIRAMGQTAAAIRADLLNDDETEALYEAATEAFGGPITCLVNSASIFEYDTIQSATRESWTGTSGPICERRLSSRRQWHGRSPTHFATQMTNR